MCLLGKKYKKKGLMGVLTPKCRIFLVSCLVEIKDCIGE